MSKEHAYAYEAGYRDGSINYELEHCPACKNVADLQEALAENEKLWKLGEQYEVVLADYRAKIVKMRELMARMAEALGIDGEWVDANWCKSSCRLEFECWPEDMDIRCPAWAAMRELGVEVDE